MELVSAIIPAYNAAATIGRAIDSALRQTHRELEVIVVNDGSTDGTEALLARDYPQVRYHYQPNQGLAATRNQGAALAGGGILAFLDADDEWTPDKTERQLAVLTARPDLSAVASHRIRVQVAANGAELTRRPSRHADGALENISFDQELWGNRICGASVMIRRPCFDRHGGYDRSLLALEDQDLWLRVLAAGESIAVLREPLYVYYETPGSLRTQLDKVEPAVAAMLAKWDPTRSSGPPLVSPRRYQEIAKWWWLKLAFHALRQGDRRRADRYAAEAGRYVTTRPLLEATGVLARRWPGLLHLAGSIKGFPRTTG